MGDSSSGWRTYREEEFKEFVTSLCKLARRNNFSVWVGGQNRPFSVVVSADWKRRRVSETLPHHSVGFALRMSPKAHYKYCYAEGVYGSPGRVPLEDYTVVVGGTVNEVLEFAAMKMETYVEKFGRPDGRAFYHTVRLDKIGEKNAPAIVAEIMKMIDWDQSGTDRQVGKDF